MPPKGKPGRKPRRKASKSKAKGGKVTKKSLPAKSHKKKAAPRTPTKSKAGAQKAPQISPHLILPELAAASEVVKSPSPVPAKRKNNLEEVYGLRGPKYLHKALTTCQDPQDMLTQFRAEEGVLVPTLKPAVALLDLLEVTRHDFHIRCAEQLRQELTDRISALSKTATKTPANQKRLEDLLDKCFSGLNLPLVRPVVLHVLKNLDTVSEKYKKEIMENKELYDVCETSLRRHVWVDRRDLFEVETLPLIEEWVLNRVQSMFDINTGTSLYTVPGNVRRQDVLLEKLVENIGDRVVLYDFAKELIKTRYLETGSPHYGTLRLDLLILLHEKQPQLVTAADNLSFKFAFWMDAAVRSRHVDSKRSGEIGSLLDALKKKDMKVFQDAAMILSDPQITYFNATTAVRLIQAVVSQDALPRDNQMLLFVLRLLYIGILAKDYVTEKLTKETKVSPNIVCDFLPKLCATMVSISALKISKDVKKATATIDLLLSTLQKESLAVWLVVQWIAYLLRSNDQNVVVGLIHLFPQFVEQLPLKDDCVIHNMVVQLAHTPQEQRWSKSFADSIFHDYFHVKSTDAVGAKHVLRLMYFVYPKLEASYRDEIIGCMESHLDNPEVKTLANTVRARIATSVPNSQLHPESAVASGLHNQSDVFLPKPT